MTDPTRAELEQAVAERLAMAIYGRSDMDLVRARAKEVFLPAAREALVIRDEAVMEAARKVRDAVLLAALALKILGPAAREQLSQPGFDDAALRKIIGLEGEGEG